MNKKIIIKKYGNRRLYDATHSKYVNLDEVAKAVQDGFDVQVVDATTGEDLTRLVLTQIIVEGAKAPDSAFPLDILRQMVVASGKASQESVLRYMKAAAEMYQSTLQRFSRGPFDLVQSLVNSGSGAQGGSQTSQATGSAAPPSEESEVAEMKRRIDELEALVSKKANRKKAHPTPGKTKKKAVSATRKSKRTK